MMLIIMFVYGYCDVAGFKHCAPGLLDFCRLSLGKCGTLVDSNRTTGVQCLKWVLRLLRLLKFKITQDGCLPIIDNRPIH